jgi:lambda repressor-like predicted transcriptional regulator
MTRRYSWDDLWALVSGRGMTMTNLAAGSGFDRRELYRARDRGWLGEGLADRVAVRLGVLPGDVWPAWHDEPEQERANRVRAGRAERDRRYRQRHSAAIRQRTADYQAAYRAQYREGLRAYRRAYYAANRQQEIRSAVERKRRARSGVIPLGDTGATHNEEVA